jgi:hypothetical protein
MDDFDHRHQDRIRAHAHRIWEEEGRPHGRDAEHWRMARELVAIEENQKLATKPVNAERIGPEGEPIEEAKLEENLGEFPTLTDQGEQEAPHRRSEDGAKEGRSEDGAGEGRSEQESPRPVNEGQAAPGAAPLDAAKRRTSSRTRKKGA